MPRASRKPAGTIPTRRSDTQASGRSAQGTKEPAQAARPGRGQERLGGSPLRRGYFFAFGFVQGIPGRARDRRPPGNRSRESRGAPPAGGYGQGQRTSGGTA